MVIALQLLDELDNIGDKVWLVVPGEMTPLLLRGRKSAHCEGITLTDSVKEVMIVRGMRLVPTKA